MGGEEELFLGCLHQMRGSMMINFSPANERAGNAGLGSLGHPFLCQQLALDDVPWALALDLSLAEVHTVTSTARAPVPPATQAVLLSVGGWGQHNQSIGIGLRIL